MNSSIEVLESRIAPAKLVGNLLTYTDIDGDKVKIAFTLPAGSAALSAANFTAGFVNGNDTTKQSLATIDLSGKTGVGLTLTATPTAAGGDGLANVGDLLATNTDLGAVSIDGDLAAADVGDGTPAVHGVKSLTVHSLDAAAASLGVVSIKDAGIIVVKGDIAGVFLSLPGGATSITVGGSLLGSSMGSSAKISASGNIGAIKIGHDIIAGAGDESGKINVTAGNIASLTVGGSVIGGLDTTADSTAQIQAAGIGPVKIAGDLRGRVANFGGAIVSSGALGDVTIGGSVIGGSADHTGYLKRSGGSGFIKIGHDLIGGSADFTGAILSDGTTTTLAIGGSVLGGSAALTDAQIRLNSAVTSITIGGDLKGGAGKNTGALIVVAKVGKITIGGSVLGGAGASTGYLNLHGADVLKIGHDLVAGSADATGTFFSQGNVGSIAIGGNIEGSATALTNAQLRIFGTLGPLTIGGDLLGGAGKNGAALDLSSVGALTIGGSVRGGAGVLSGEISVLLTSGKIKIGHDLVGSSADAAGSLDFGAQVASLTIGGSIIGGSMDLTRSQIFMAQGAGPILIGGDVRGGSGAHAGELTVTHLATSVTIGGSVIGGSVSDTGVLNLYAGTGALKIGHDLLGGSNAGASTIISTGYINSLGNIGTITVGGSIISGENTGAGSLSRSGAIGVSGTLGALNVTGSILGNATNILRINASGLSNVPAIKSISVGGSVSHAMLLAGYDANASHVSNTSGLGSVTIGGDLIASNILACGTAGNDGILGNSDDNFTAATAKIATIVVKGTILGTTGGADTFLIGAGILGSVKFGKGSLKLTAAADQISFSATSDYLAKDHA